MQRTRLGLAVLAIAVAAVGAATRGGGDDRPATQARGATSGGAFAPCRAGRGGGGYRIRVAGTSCRTARAALPRMLAGEPVTIRRRERVHVNGDGWSCLVQALGALRASQVACVRGRQLIVYRVA